MDFCWPYEAISSVKNTVAVRCKHKWMLFVALIYRYAFDAVIRNETEYIRAQLRRNIYRMKRKKKHTKKPTRASRS